MSELGDVLEAMNAAPRGFDVLLGEISTWQDIDVIRAAMQRNMGHGNVVFSALPSGGPDEPERPITRLWFARDGRFRAEQPWLVHIFDGTDLWMGHDNRLTQQAPSPDPIATIPCGILLRPGPLMGLGHVTITGHDRVAGHDSVILDGAASPQPHLHFPPLFHGDRLRLHVDVGTGLLLRFETWFDGQPATRIEFEALDYDAPLVHDPFRSDVEPGVQVWTQRDLQREMLERSGIDTEGVDHDTDRSLMGGGRGPAHVPSSLSERYMPVGPLPDDVDAARAAVIAAIEGMSELDDDDGLPNVQGGSNLGEAVTRAQQRHNIEAPARYEVDEIVFVRADEAVVAFRVMVPMAAGGFPQTGRVLKVGDRWKVERGTVCSLLGMAGVSCPPPPVDA